MSALMARNNPRGVDEDSGTPAGSFCAHETLGRTRSATKAARKSRFIGESKGWMRNTNIFVRGRFSQAFAIAPIGRADPLAYGGRPSHVWGRLDRRPGQRPRAPRMPPQIGNPQLCASDEPPRLTS